MKHPIAIQLTGISKQYQLHHEKPTLVETFVKTNRRYETFWALKNIHLTVQKGEKVGVVGPNGSGKTTLLKIIAGITAPTTGSVATHGSIVSLIDLEAGFHPDLTGFENIFLNGMVLGMTKRDIRRLIPSIIRFADIGQFIDAPLFTYSEGMKLRLSFAVAVHANPDILILDESLSIGDENFQKKAMRRIEGLFQKGTTILVVSHWTEFIKTHCTRILLLHKGKIRADGPPNRVCRS